MKYNDLINTFFDELDNLDSIKEKYDLKIYKYEVWNDSENMKLMNDIASFLDVNVRGVPFAIIDNTAIFGYSSGVTDETYRYHIKQASKDDFIDEVGIELGVVKGKTKVSKNNDNKEYETNYTINRK